MNPSQAETLRIADMRRKLEKDPSSRVFFDLAREYYEAGRFQEAVDICSRGLRQHASYLSARVLLGRIYFDMGRSDDSREQMEMALQQAPDNLVARRVLAQICLEQGDLHGALERFRALLAFSPTDAEAAARVDQIERRLSATEPAVEDEPRGVEAVAAPAPPAGPEAVAQPERALPLEVEPPPPTPVAPAAVPAEPVPVPEELEELVAEASTQIVVEVLPDEPGVAEASTQIVVEVLPDEPGVAEASLEPGVLATPTLAEIYLDQGLNEKAAMVYREILRGDPANAEALARIAEIERAEAPPDNPRAESARRRIQALSAWLEAIRGASRA